MNININEYKYKYEMHLHTSESSACARSSGAEMALAHKEAGYTGIVVTDHAWGGNTCIDRSLPYEEFIYQYAAGYRAAKKMGDEIGLQVFFGMEAGFEGTEFLIYGIESEKMAQLSQLWDADIPTQYKLVHDAGGIVMHAHPYREEWYIPKIRLYPEYIDGVEIINATHSNPNSKSHNKVQFDMRAIKYAKKLDCATCAGSDIHINNPLGGGIILKRPVDNYTELVDIIRNKGDYILTNGDKYFTRTGDIIEKS